MKNIYLKPPRYLTSLKFDSIKDRTIFLAGSISNAHDWQEGAAKRLLEYLNVVNPRRDNFNTLDAIMEKQQITWEHHYLSRVKYLLFYFSHETLAPITLFEYGCALEQLKSGKDMEIFVCVHPDYKRKRDVEIQTELKFPDNRIKIYSDLDNLLWNIEFRGRSGRLYF